MGTKPENHLYLVTLIDAETGKTQDVWVESPCADDMQEFFQQENLDEFLKQGPALEIQNPQVWRIVEWQGLRSRVILQVA